MSQSSDLDVLKDIPGYKAILKSVLKSQIQLLIEQLADHTGEESIILTASINDGTLSHLGSTTGKGFLEGRDDMKSQFLGYCLKTYHRKKTVETKSPANQRSNQRHMPYRTPPKRDRIHPVSLQRAQIADDSGPGLVDPSEPQLETNQTGSEYVKIEEHEADTSTSTFPSSLQLSHTQTSGDLEKTGQGNGEGEGHIRESCAKDSSNGASESSATDIKIEPITENEMELEITGVEPGNVSLGQDDWGQGQTAGYATPSDGDTSLNQSADASNYNSFMKATSTVALNPPVYDLTGDDDDDQQQRNATDQPPLPDFSRQGFSIVDVTSIMSGDHALDPNIPQFVYADTPAGGQYFQVVKTNATDNTPGIQAPLPQATPGLPIVPDLSQGILQPPARDMVPPAHPIVPDLSQGILQTTPRDMVPPQDRISFRGRQPTRGRGRGREKERASTRIPHVKRPVNPLKSVNFNRELYGICKSKIMLKRYICPVCGRRCMKKCDLERHSRVHTGERPFVCPKCRRAYKQKSALYGHMRRNRCIKYEYDFSR